MSDTFDYDALAFDAYMAGNDLKKVAAYLRERIEAAFVPRKQPLHCETCGTDVAEVLCAKCGKWWRDNSPEVHEATARAEAAEARVKVLEEALRELQGYGCPVCNGDCGSANPPVVSCPMQCICQALGAEHE